MSLRLRQTVSTSAGATIQPTTFSSVPKVRNDVVDFHPHMKTATSIDAPTNKPTSAITKPSPHHSSHAATEQDLRRRLQQSRVDGLAYRRQFERAQEQMSQAEREIRRLRAELNMQRNAASNMRTAVGQQQVMYSISLQVIVPAAAQDEHGTIGRVTIKQNEQYPIWLVFDVADTNTPRAFPEKTAFLLRSKKIGHSPWSFGNPRDPDTDVVFDWNASVPVGTSSVQGRDDSLLIIVEDMSNLRPLDVTANGRGNVSIHSQPATRYIMKLGTMKCLDTSAGTRRSADSLPKGPMQMTISTSLDGYDQLQKDIIFTPCGVGQLITEPHEVITVMSNVSETRLNKAHREEHGKPIVYEAETASGDDSVLDALSNQAAQLGLMGPRTSNPALMATAPPTATSTPGGLPGPSSVPGQYALPMHDGMQRPPSGITALPQSNSFGYDRSN